MMPWSRRGRDAKSRHGLRQTANTRAAVAIRSQAIPGGGSRANSNTAKDGPR